jgi:hypothetical protein
MCLPGAYLAPASDRPTSHMVELMQTDSFRRAGAQRTEDKQGSGWIVEGGKERDRDLERAESQLDSKPASFQRQCCRKRSKSEGEDRADQGTGHSCCCDACVKWPVHHRMPLCLTSLAGTLTTTSVDPRKACVTQCLKRTSPRPMHAMQDLQEQVRDLMVYLEASSIASGNSEMAGGSVELAAEQKQRGKHRNRQR